MSVDPNESVDADGTGGRLGAEAATLRAFADALLPGDDLFPSASAVGAHGWLAERLRERHGPDGVLSVAVAIEGFGQEVARRETAATPQPHPPSAGEGGTGGAFAGLDDAGRIEAVRRFEATDPERFAELRTWLTYGYYQTPLVVRAVRALGFPYNDAPQPLGYAMEPFDPARDAPARPCGGYKATAEVARVDLAPVGGRPVMREAEAGP